MANRSVKLSSRVGLDSHAKLRCKSADTIYVLDDQNIPFGLDGDKTLNFYQIEDFWRALHVGDYGEGYVLGMVRSYVEVPSHLRNANLHLLNRLPRNSKNKPVLVQSRDKLQLSRNTTKEFKATLLDEYYNLNGNGDPVNFYIYGVAGDTEMFSMALMMCNPGAIVEDIPSMGYDYDLYEEAPKFIDMKRIIVASQYWSRQSSS